MTGIDGLGIISGIVGGLGLFLLGMLLLTENLRAVASDSLNAALKKFTAKPLLGVAMGTGVTAVLQSSSATTLITIGLVGAGLLSFPRSLSIIYGANLGTSSTAWIVALVGLKVSMTALSLPLLGLGAAMRLFARGSWRYVGMGIAGFALIFLGIDFLQLSMRELSPFIDPAGLARSGVGGLALMLLLGMVMTVVMQSSSAAVTVTLALLHSGSLTLELAAAAVIGQNIGTTVTAAIGAISTSIHARRTALAHVLFNVVTAAVALSIFPIFIALMDRLANDHDEIALALFQTSFNLLGVLLFLPMTSRFAGWVERLLPDTQAISGLPTLDVTHVTGQRAAVEGATLATRRIADEVTRIAQVASVGPLHGDVVPRIEALRTALGSTFRYLRAAPVELEQTSTYRARLALTHALDHLGQMTGVLAGLPRRTRASIVPAALTRACGAHLAAMREALREGAAPEATSAEALAASYSTVREAREEARQQILDDLARASIESVTANEGLKQVRRVDELSRHAWRAAHYLVESAQATAPGASAAVPLESEVVENDGEALSE